MRSVAAGRCLDVNAGSTTAGTPLQIWDCNGGTNQTWTRTASGQLTVCSGDSTRCAAASGTRTGAAVAITACDGGAGQRWQFNANGTVTDAQSGLCLDVNGAATANGTKTILWTCHGGGSQQWTTGRRACTGGRTRRFESNRPSKAGR
ncbi:RICIN domain-containing protein [Lentzea flaviverrucosa]|nr:RICIN domain-containing protein [Lentzea flaviverrucosa]